MACRETVDIRRNQPRSPWYASTTTPSSDDNLAQARADGAAVTRGDRWAMP